MATINISDLRPTGSDLFSDSEGYMNELGDSELDLINGGSLTTPVCAVTAAVSVGALSVAVASPLIIALSNPLNSF
jgi:hypothetical protein